MPQKLSQTNLFAFSNQTANPLGKAAISSALYLKANRSQHESDDRLSQTASTGPDLSSMAPIKLRAPAAPLIFQWSVVGRCLVSLDPCATAEHHRRRNWSPAAMVATDVHRAPRYLPSWGPCLLSNRRNTRRGGRPCEKVKMSTCWTGEHPSMSEWRLRRRHRR